MGFDLPPTIVGAAGDARADAARDERHRAASDETKRLAADDARPQVESSVSSRTLTTDRAQSLRQRIQEFARQRGEQFTSQEISDILRPIIQPHVANGECEQAVLDAATTPLPTEQPAEAPQGNSPQPNPDDPNAALVADTGADRFVKNPALPNAQPLVARPVLADAPVAAAVIPTAVPLPQPPPPGAPLPNPKGPGVAPHDGNPLVATGGDQLPTLVGAPLIAAPGVPDALAVPVESPTPRVGGFQFASLGEPVKGMNGEEQQQAYGELLNHGANLRMLTSTARVAVPFQSPLPRVQGDGFALSDSSYACSTSDEGSSTSTDGATASTGTRRGPATRRDLGIGYFRCKPMV